MNNATPCKICGETTPKTWEDYEREKIARGMPPGTAWWGGHHANCPECGHLALFSNTCSFNPETGELISRGAPQWVYDMYKTKDSK